jgi:hypothetical protein
MSEQVKTKRLLQVDVDFSNMVNVEKFAHMTRLRFARENAVWLAALLREVANEISDAYGEG